MVVTALGDSDYISTHSARVGGDGAYIARCEEWLEISTHSARVGGDTLSLLFFIGHGISTHSARVGGDEVFHKRPSTERISTHSARVGGDGIHRITSRLYCYFNPLRPCGRRLVKIGLPIILAVISTHSARVGGDAALQPTAENHRDFNPLRPCGRRPRIRRGRPAGRDFNPLRPCGRRHNATATLRAVRKISTHSARVGGDV